MATEIERKFLIMGDFKKNVFRSTHIHQGYITHEPDKTVRIRKRDDKAYITIKGKSNKSGTSRYEWEKEISLNDADDLLLLCGNDTIEKIRHEIKVGIHTFEVDEFLGKNKGLIIAEVELKSEKENFIHPLWLGKEVTGDIKYYNSSLSTKPYETW